MKKARSLSIQSRRQSEELYEDGEVIEDLTPDNSKAIKTAVGISNLILSGVWGMISVAHFADGHESLGIAAIGFSVIAGYLSLRTLNSRNVTQPVQY